MRTKSLLFGLCSRARLCSPRSAVAAGAGTVTSTWRCRGAGLPGASGAPDEVTGLGRVWVELPVGACAEHELPVPGGCAGRPPARPRRAPARALACACSPPELWLWRRCRGIGHSFSRQDPQKWYVDGKSELLQTQLRKGH